MELLLAYILLDSQQQAYTHQILSLPGSIQTKDILSITLPKRDGNAKPEDLFEYNLMLSTAQSISNYSPNPDQQVSVEFKIDPAEEVELISYSSISFSRKNFY